MRCLFSLYATKPETTMLLRFHRRASTTRLHPFVTSLSNTHPFSTSPPSISDAAARTRLLNSIRTLQSADAAVSVSVDFFHRMLTLNPFPCIQDFNLLFGIVAKSQHFATAISLIKTLHSLGYEIADVCTLNILINCLCRLRKTTLGFAVLGLMTKIGLEPTLVTLNTIANGLCIVSLQCSNVWGVG
ncbi:hypothetical protein GLYMA_16G206551v4 [Glycine max]|nr:hypothetical protein GLYMA_16G206551v4 [Glycine max]KAH1152183.1 hypothetical protein GYH30_045609 [Glycine max]